MRISTLSFHNATLAGIREQQSAIARLSEQIAGGKRILSPKDDPIGSTRVYELTSRIDMRNQYLSNQDKASLTLTYESTIATEMRNQLQNARSQLFGVAPGQTKAAREQASDLISAAYNQLKDLANSRDASGNYVFGGFKTAAPPFSHTQVAPDSDANPATHAASGPTTYSGTPAPGGLRYAEIDYGRKVQLNDNLDNLLKSGTADDLLQALDQIAIDLREDPFTLLTQSDIDTAVAAINGALDRLGSVERRIAVTQLEVADAQKTTKALLLAEQNALGKIVDTDQAAAIIELQLRQTTLQAAEQTFARTANLSLFNYLS